MSVVHALVHTTGVVLGREYVPLEVAYCDVTGYEYCFLLRSPMSFRVAQTNYPYVQPDARMSTHNGVTLDTVRQFVHDRISILKDVLKRSDIVFGYKGESHQKKFLDLMDVPHTVNVERFLVPSLFILRQLYPYMVVTDCPYHVTISRCAFSAVRMLITYMMEQNLVLPISQ